MNEPGETALPEPGELHFAAGAAFYDGHFDGNPVTPAIAQIAACLASLAASGALRGRRAQPLRARFYAVIGAGETVRLTWKLGPEGGAEAALHRSGQLCSRITFKLADASGGPLA